MSIYFDNAATTVQKPPQVTEAIYEALSSQKYGNPSRGAHGYSLNAYHKIFEGRQRIKQLFSATDAYEVAFTANSTMALNEVLKGLLVPGNHVLTTSWEHNSVLRPLYQLEADGCAVDFISSDPLTGALHYEELQEKLRPETTMLVCNHASNVTGNVLDLDRMKEFCQDHGLRLVVDASQTAGAYPIDLSDEAIDAVCFTGHKALGGPEGTGGVCLKKNLDLQPQITGGDGVYSFSHTQPKEIPGVLEAGTMNSPGIMGLSAGVQCILDRGLDDIMARQAALSDLFIKGIKAIPNIVLYGDFTGPRVSVFSLNIDEADSALVSDILWEEYEIATRSGYHCAPLMHEVLGTKDKGTVRFSFSNFTQEEEVKSALKALKKIAKQ